MSLFTKERKLPPTGEHRFTSGSIWRQMLVYMIPVMLGSLLQQLYNTVDTIIVGRYLGVAALAAVGGSTSTVTTLLVNFFAGLSGGAAAIVAQDYGAGDMKRRNQSAASALTLGIGIGIGLLVFGELIVGWLLHAMRVADEVYPYALSYLRIYMLGLIPISLYNMGSAIFNAVGDSHSAFRFLAVSCIVNILLDLLFVGSFGWGIAGAAIATCIAQLISAVLILLTLFRRKILTLPLQMPSTGDMGRILKIGMPAGLQSGLYSIANMVIQWKINQYPIESVAALSAYERVEGIFWTLMVALGVAVTTFTGQNYGAGEMQRMRKSVRVSMYLGLGIAAAIGGICMLFARQISGLFITDTETIQITARLILILMPFFITYVPTEVFGGTLKGCGDGLRPMLLTLIFTCLIRVLWVVVTAMIPDCSFMGLLACFPFTWAASSVAFTISYLRGRWLRQS